MENQELADFIDSAIEESRKRTEHLAKPIASVCFSKEGYSLEVTLDNTKSYYGDWIKGEGGDISLYRDQETDKVVGAHLPCYAKTLVIGGNFPTITIDLTSGKVSIEENA